MNGSEMHQLVRNSFVRESLSPEEIRQCREYLAWVVNTPASQAGKVPFMDKITAIELDAILAGEL
ncbi:MAG: hypothetical protein WCP60_11435 [bacterium]